MNYEEINIMLLSKDIDDFNLAIEFIMTDKDFVSKKALYDYLNYLFLPSEWKVWEDLENNTFIRQTRYIPYVGYSNTTALS